MSRFLIGSSIAAPICRPGDRTMMKLPVLLVALAASFAAVTPALGQANLSFSYTLADGNLHALANGTTITFPSVDVNATTSAAVFITNSGSSAGTVSALSVTGTGFRISNPNLLPASVAPGDSLGFSIVFAPAQPGSFTGTFQIVLPSAVISGTLAGSTPPPNFSPEYIDPTTGNTLPLSNTTPLQFLNTQVGATSTITVLIANTGTGTGSVTAVALNGGTGSAFQLINLAPLPVNVGPSQALTFGIRFTPLAQQLYTDVLTLTAAEQTTTVNLQGQAIQPIYSYQFSGSAGKTTVLAGGTVAIPDTGVGQLATLTVTVSNTGLGAGQVSLINVTGAGFSLSNLPAALPVTIQPGGNTQFTLTFAPAQPGAVTGRLTFGTDTITLTATAVGSQLNYTYTSGSTAVPVTANGAVIFAPLAVGSTESLTFSIENGGTTATTLSSISLAAPSTIFALSSLPGLPATLNPGATISFSISFTPNNTANLTATLLVNSVSFTVSGNGTPPPSLPAYSFVGPSGTEQPDQQPGVGLTLASPYPYPLQGILTLAFTSNVFAGDSSIQFANGALSVNFTIPANTTQALFSGNATAVPLQSGTTSGNIVITPSFSLQNGFNVTPTSPATLTLTIPGLAPQLLSGSISSATTTSFILTLSGFTTSRVLDKLSIQFTPVSGHTFSPGNMTIDVSTASASWFQGSAASAYGGSFLLQVQFVLSGGTTTADLVGFLQSLSITATNNVGASNQLVVPIQ
jgi:hypothetical protein